MPIYEYHCAKANKTVEVMHNCSTVISTWGQLCEAAGIDIGQVPTDSPVDKLMASKVAVHGATQPKTSLKQAPVRTGCCGGGCRSNH
jgi:hypothetical protein